MIDFDASSSGAASSTSLTYSHTCTGSNLILRVGVGVESGSDLVSGVTYNGVAMTLIDKQLNAVFNNEYVYLFELVAPATGANDVVVSLSSSAAVRSTSCSYTGAKQSGQPDSSNKATAQNSPQGVSTNIVAPGSWVVGIAQADAGAPVASTGVTSRVTQNNINMGDSNGGQSAGAYAMNWTDGPTAVFNLIVASIAPIPEAGDGNPMVFSGGGLTLG